MRSTWRIWPMFLNGVRGWKRSGCKVLKKAYLWFKSASIFRRTQCKYKEWVVWKIYPLRIFLTIFVSILWILEYFFAGYLKSTRNFTTQLTTLITKKTWGGGRIHMVLTWLWIGRSLRYYSLQAFIYQVYTVLCARTLFTFNLFLPAFDVII